MSLQVLYKHIGEIKMSKKKLIKRSTKITAGLLVGSLGAMGLNVAEAKQMLFVNDLGSAGSVRHKILSDFESKTNPQVIYAANHEGKKDKSGEGKCGEGKCGEGKCGDDKKSTTPAPDHKTTEGKCGEGKCGE
jgi:uncharacterized low-complexity protein